jgi:hypothetical protein
MRRSALVLALLTLPALIAQQERTARFRPVPAGVGRDVAQPSTRVITTGIEWNAFLQDYSVSLRERTSINFRKHTVAVIFAGEKPSGGYATHVTKVVHRGGPGGGTAVVHHIIACPPAGAMVTQALTYPSAIIVIEKRFQNVEFEPPA